VNTCPDNGTKVDVTGAYPAIILTAPNGFLISGYCVKAGSDKQGLGPEEVVVYPAQATVTLTHTSGKDISHYTYTLIEFSPPPPCTRPGEQSIFEGPACVPPSVTTTIQPPAPTTAPPVTSVATTAPPSVPSTTIPTSVSSEVLHATVPTAVAGETLAYTGVNAGGLLLLAMLAAAAGHALQRASKKLGRKA
jgi:hypothetical protein